MGPCRGNRPGESCAKYQNRAKIYLSLVFCYGCDPEEPLHFRAPVNGLFFNGSRTVKICTDVIDKIAPVLFSDCGMTLPDDRETICSPDSPIVPDYVWPDCQDQQYICQDHKSQEWSCRDTPCDWQAIPLGFRNEPCNLTERTCDGALKMVNDNRGAKPPNYEDYAVEVVDTKLCMQSHNDADKCRCLRVPPIFGRASEARMAWWTFSITFFHLLSFGLL